jgi:hypothetical protein
MLERQSVISKKEALRATTRSAFLFYRLTVGK